MTPAEKIDSGSPTIRAEGAFQIAFESGWGFPVILNEIRDRTILKKLIDQIGEQAVLDLIPVFIRASQPVTRGGDPVVSRCRFANIPDFCYHAQYLLKKARSGPTLSDRTAENVAEAMKATGRINGTRSIK